MLILWSFVALVFVVFGAIVWAAISSSGRERDDHESLYGALEGSEPEHRVIIKV